MYLGSVTLDRWIRLLGANGPLGLNVGILLKSIRVSFRGSRTRGCLRGRHGGATNAAFNKCGGNPPPPCRPEPGGRSVRVHLWSRGWRWARQKACLSGRMRRVVQCLRWRLAEVAGSDCRQAGGIRLQDCRHRLCRRLSRGCDLTLKWNLRV